MKEERLHRVIALVTISIVAIALGLLVNGCSKDCPVCPKEPHVPDYHLVFSCVGPIYPAYVITYSTKSGEVIDSAFYPGHPFDNLAFTSDGKYACYTYGWNLRLGNSETWVTDAATGDTISYLLGTGGIGFVSRNNQLLLLPYGNILAILRIPSLEIVYRDSIPVRGGALHPTKQLAYFIKEPNQDTLFVLDFSLTPPRVTRSMPIRDRQGNPLWCSDGRVFCTDRYLMLNPTLFDVTSYLQFYDLDSLTLVRETRTRLYYGWTLHPDGKRLFLTYVTYFPGLWPKSGGMDVYSIETNTLYPYYSDGEVNLGVGQPFTPNGIQFTPDGETMYVLSAAGVFPLGPILEIRTSTKEIVRRFEHNDGSSRLIVLNPKDWAE